MFKNHTPFISSSKS